METSYFQTVIEDTDSLVDIPIQAEIIKTYHSGKTGIDILENN